MVQVLFLIQVRVEDVTAAADVAVDAAVLAETHVDAILAIHAAAKKSKIAKLAVIYRKRERKLPFFYIRLLMMDSAQTIEDIKFLHQQLGRTPRGLMAIAHRNFEGLPSVIRVSTIVNDQPFPTIYWLTDSVIVKNISRLEAAGVVKEIEEKILQSPSFLAEHLSDQASYHTLRDQFVAENSDEITAAKLRIVFRDLGFGGISNWNRVRCLHMFYAHHLVHGNFVGKWLDQNYFFPAPSKFRNN